jgi:hypothetical protein
MDGSRSTVSQYEPLCPCLYVDEGVGNVHLFWLNVFVVNMNYFCFRVGALQRYKRI